MSKMQRASLYVERTIYTASYIYGAVSVGLTTWVLAVAIL